MKSNILPLIPLVSTLLSGQLSGAVTYYSVAGYHGKNDNPFANNKNIDTVYLENFETQGGTLSNKLTTPYATGWNGASSGGREWGVQSDYSSDDEMGSTWSDAAQVEGWTKAPEGIHFDFTTDTYGRLPEYVGAAILGRVDQLNVGGLYNSIFVYDKDGNEVTGGLWKLPRPLYSELELIDPDEYFSNFEGIYVPGGISRIQFRDFVEVDHLTYGYAPIPEPGTLSLAGVAAASLLRRRSRKRIV